MKASAITQQTGNTSVSQVCACFGLKRDAWYKYKKRDKHRQEEVEQAIRMVKTERKVQPRVGTRKLHSALSKNFCTANLKIGRDRLFDILRSKNMLVKTEKGVCKNYQFLPPFPQIQQPDKRGGSYKTKPGVGFGYNVHPHGERLLLFGTYYRHVFTENYWA